MVSWNISVRRALRQSELVISQSLSSLLSNVFFYAGTQPTFVLYLETSFYSIVFLKVVL